MRSRQALEKPEGGPHAGVSAQNSTSSAHVRHAAGARVLVAVVNVPDVKNALETPPPLVAQDIPPVPAPTADGPEYFPVLGVPVSVTSLTEASHIIHRWATDSLGRFMVTRDMFGVMAAADDPDLLALHKQADMVAPEGMALVWLGRLAGKPVSRTHGVDLMDRVFHRSERSGLKHYFYGGNLPAARKLRDQAWRRFHRLKIVGLDAPSLQPPTPEDLTAVAAAMNASGADVVWVGLPTPQQEFLLRDLRPLVHATLIGVGEAFDAYAGPRAPRWMHQSGVEWIWSLASNPLLNWRRYVLGAPRFVFRVVLSAAGVKG